MKKKKIIFSILFFIVLIGLTGCSLFKNSEKNKQNGSNNKNQMVENDKGDDNMTSYGKELVLYFSATGTTEKVAKLVANVTGADILEIVPEIKYTTDDLNYNNDNSRANKEQNDKNARPKIKNISSINDYDIIYLGYPIWWGEVPKVILTLLESYDFNNKMIIPFCTSGSSEISQSVNTLKSYYKNINWLEGKRFDSSVSEVDVQKWVQNLNIKKERKLYIKINDNILTATLENNSSVNAFVKKLIQSDITIDMRDYGNFEKVGELGFDLPKNDKQITTTPGDIILYQGNSITIYYDTNNWNFTKLGHIENITQEELKQILGNGNVIVTFSIEK